jgi:hypothetical protein
MQLLIVVIVLALLIHQALLSGRETYAQEEAAQVRQLRERHAFVTSGLHGSSNYAHDPNFVSLLYNLRGYKGQNRAEYARLVEILNDFLAIASEFDRLQHTQTENYEVARDLARAALNCLYGFIHTTGHHKIYQDQHRSAMQRLMHLCERHLDAMHKMLGREVSVNTRYVIDAKSFKPYDAAASPFDWF